MRKNFFRCQRTGNLKNAVILAMILLFPILISGAWLGDLLTGPLPEDATSRLAVFVLIPAVIVCFLALWLYLLLRALAARRRLYRRYRSLPPSDKAQVNTELADGCTGIRFGENRLYFRSRGYLQFVDYAQIAGLRPRNRQSAMIMRSNIGYGFTGCSINPMPMDTRLILADQDGMEYLIDHIEDPTHTLEELARRMESAA